MGQTFIGAYGKDYTYRRRDASSTTMLQAVVNDEHPVSG
jgi:hypothetical protein